MYITLLYNLHETKIAINQSDTFSIILSNLNKFRPIPFTKINRQDNGDQVDQQLPIIELNKPRKFCLT